MYNYYNDILFFLMIYQGLFSILHKFSDNIDLFYNIIYNHFQGSICNHFNDKIFEKFNVKEVLEKIIEYTSKIFFELGFDHCDLQHNFSNHFLDVKKFNYEKITSISNLYKIMFPAICDIFLTKIFKYLIGSKSAARVIMELRAKGILPIEFLMELKNLKNLYEKAPKKIEKLKKYLQIRKEIINKLQENREKIERVMHLKDPQDKLQLIFMIYKIMDFFSIQKFFDFTPIIEYCKNNSEEWLETIPLISFNNPDLYYCGIYIARQLSIKFEEEEEDNIKYFLINIYDELIDEFEAPLIEATYQVYYFLKASDLSGLELSFGQIKELLKGGPKFFEINYLKYLGTSQLVVILKTYKLLGVYHKIDPKKIKAILYEIEQRITAKGIMHYRDGFFTSEATYYVLFCKYMTNDIKSVNDYNILGYTISKIYRNLEMLNISEEANYDLINELFYALETLKLLNCIENPCTLIHLARDLFPNYFSNKLFNEKKQFKDISYLSVNHLTGETIYKTNFINSNALNWDVT